MAPGGGIQSFWRSAEWNGETRHPEKELRWTTREIGVEDLFENGVADLSGMSDSSGLFALKIAQKVYIKVDVRGAEAAAAIASKYICKFLFSFSN